MKTRIVIAALSVGASIMVYALVVVKQPVIHAESFDKYLNNPVLLDQHRVFCESTDSTITHCAAVIQYAKMLETPRTLYEQRKVEYDELKFLLRVEGREDIKKSLKNDLKIIKKLIPPEG